MVTVEPYVGNYILTNNLINPKILFVTENCPNPDNYFYRTLNPANIVRGNANLLNCLCGAFGINGNTELLRLNDFLHHRKYLLIDTYQSGRTYEQGLIQHAMHDIISDILLLNPVQIVFTTIRSNNHIVNHLLPHPIIGPRIIANGGRKIFPFPGNRQYVNFAACIQAANAAGGLVL